MRAGITPTSLPDTAVDPALRRLLAPTGRFVRKATAGQPDAAPVVARFVDKLAAGSMAVDPTDFVPAGVMAAVGRTASAAPAARAAADVEGRPARRRADPLPPRRPARASGEVFVFAGRQVDPLLALRSGRDTSGPRLRFRAGQARRGWARRGVPRQHHRRQPRHPYRRHRAERRDRATADRTDRRARRAVPIEPIEPTHRAAHRPDRDLRGPTVTVPPLVRDALVLNRFEAAIAQIADVGALAETHRDARARALRARRRRPVARGAVPPVQRPRRPSGLDAQLR